MDKEQIKAEMANRIKSCLENGGKDVTATSVAESLSEEQVKDVQEFVKKTLATAPRVDCGIF